MDICVHHQNRVRDELFSLIVICQILLPTVHIYGITPDVYSL